MLERRWTSCSAQQNGVAAPRLFEVMAAIRRTDGDALWRSPGNLTHSARPTVLERTAPNHARCSDLTAPTGRKIDRDFPARWWGSRTTDVARNQIPSRIGSGMAPGICSIRAAVPSLQTRQCSSYVSLVCIRPQRPHCGVVDDLQNSKMKLEPWASRESFYPRGRGQPDPTPLPALPLWPKAQTYTFLIFVLVRITSEKWEIHLHS